MGFLRRKSVAAADAEETRPRNRLSKPMTNRSPVSQRSTSTKQSPKTGSQDDSMSSRTTLEETLGTLSRQESGTQIEPYMSGVKEDLRPRTTVSGPPKKTAVASLVMQFETAASSSQLSLPSPTVVRKPLPSTAGLKRSSELQQQHIPNNGSRDPLQSFTNSKSTLVSPTASLELLVDPFAIPRRRESKYRPGDATRRADIEGKEQQPIHDNDRSPPNLNKVLPQLQNNDRASDQQDDWTPSPPAMARTGTPTGLEKKSIGNLRLGSLHIVNGRASPVLSELSRHLISRQLRDVSSEYADSTYSKEGPSEAWEDEHVVDDAEEVETDVPRTPTRGSMDVGDRNVVTPTARSYPSASHSLTSGHSDVRTPDRTSMMAQAYMSELRGSPFSQGSISPPSTSSVQHPFDDDHEVSSLDTDTPEPEPQHDKVDQVQQACGPPLLSSGSVIRHQVQKDHLYNTDSHGINEEKQRQSFESEQPSIQTNVSVPETAGSRDQVFSSALEYQPPTFRPPPSPERIVSPDSLRPAHLERQYEKVDSGYNSGNSILSFSLKETKILPKQEPLTVNTAQFEEHTKVEASNSTSPKKPSSPFKLGRFFPIRPGMHKSPATAPVVPTIESLRPQSFSNTTNIPASVKQTSQSPGKTKKEIPKEDKSSKMHKKLHKAKPQSKTKGSRDIVVQRLASCESTLDIPAIPETTKANLQLRSQQVPELERTFKSQDHIRNQPSMTTLMNSPMEIRFPSPMPILDDDDQLDRYGRRDRGHSKSRPRSKSRRRSFLDVFRSDKESGKREATSKTEPNELSIEDFGDVIASLGANPYDIAHSRTQSSDSLTQQVSGPRTNPHDISTNRPRKRLSMNDEEASEFARRRSVSVNGHDGRGERRSLFDDRGGVKYVRTSMAADDIPPMPPLPNKDELRRISQRYSQQSSQLGTPESTEKLRKRLSSLDRQPGSSPAPPPPAHSPHPPYVNQSYEEQYPVEDELELAPPPPSHSPAPMDIYAPAPPSHSTRPLNEAGDAWEQQARAWKAKRLSANEALRSHRQSLDLEADGWAYGNTDALEYGEDVSYPVIPPRHPGRQTYWHQEPESWVDDSGYYYPPEHSQFAGHSQMGNNRGRPYDDQYYSYQAEMSFQPRQHRQLTWEESQDYVSNGTPSQMSHRDLYGSRQSNQRSMTSLDSRQSFYSHHNCPIDRPFDPPPRASHEYNYEYGYQDEYYTPQPSPARGRRQARQDYDRVYNGYEGDYEPAYLGGHRPVYYPDDQAYMGYGPTTSSKRQMTPQRRDDHQRSSKSRSPHPSASRPNSRPPVPRSPAASRPASRPTSRHSRRSFHSNASAASLAEELHPEIQQRPSAAPEFGRYSGGMSFGYEREAGFGGSAGTRSVSGKADAAFKGKPLRGSHGVDLGDVPVIGVLKKAR